MRDPHVESLRYRLETEHGEFTDPEPIYHELDGFCLTLKSNRLQVDMKEHFASEEHAKTNVERFLRAWEIDATLRYGKPEIHFVFEKSTIVDRDPPPTDSSVVLQASAAGAAAVAGDLTVLVNRSAYPDPPQRFRLHPDVATLWQRYRGYLKQREPLLSMAYFCLTVIETRAGGRKQAARRYDIHEDVLRKLGELCSTRGDAKSARKFTGKIEPVSAREADWIRATVKAIIHRVGEWDSGGSLPQICMGDLPAL